MTITRRSFLIGAAAVVGVAAVPAVPEIPPPAFGRLVGPIFKEGDPPHESADWVELCARSSTWLFDDRSYDSAILRHCMTGLAYRYRNLVERFFNKLKHFRAVATRYDKRADNFLAGVKLAAFRIWCRFNESMT